MAMNNSGLSVTHSKLAVARDLSFQVYVQLALAPGVVCCLRRHEARLEVLPCMWDCLEAP